MADWGACDGYCGITGINALSNLATEQQFAIFQFYSNEKNLGKPKNLLGLPKIILGMPKSEVESSKSMQDYLRAIAALSNNGDPVSTTEISRYFKIAPASVTEMLKKLSENGYVNYSSYHGSTLNAKGLKEAQKITRKHRLLERFLSDVLHIGKDQVHTQACEMEHSLSDEAEESLCRFLNHPGKCPDDDKIIPACDLPFSTCEECIALHKQGLEEVGKRQHNLKSICNLKSGVNAKVSFIRGEHRTLQRLLDMGLTPGTPIKIERVAPLKGPIEVCVRGSKLALGQDIAANVFVDLDGNNIQGENHFRRRRGWRGGHARNDPTSVT